MVSITFMHIFSYVFFLQRFQCYLKYQCDVTDSRVHFDGLLQKLYNSILFSYPWCNTMNISAVIEIWFLKKKWQCQRRYYMIYIIVISMRTNIFVYVALKNVIFSCSCSSNLTLQHFAPLKFRVLPSGPYIILGCPVVDHLAIITRIDNIGKLYGQRLTYLPNLERVYCMQNYIKPQSRKKYRRNSYFYNSWSTCHPTWRRVRWSISTAHARISREKSLCINYDNYV